MERVASILVFIFAFAAFAGCGPAGGGDGRPDSDTDDRLDMPGDEAGDGPLDRQEDSHDGEDPSPGEEPAPTCEPMTDRSCIMLRRGESEYFRFFDNYETIEFDDEGTVRTVVRLHELVDEEIAPQPGDFRYKIYGTDGYTHSDYLYWENFLGGYIEIGTRKVVFDVEQELPHLFRVKDAYLVVLFPL